MNSKLYKIIDKKKFKELTFLKKIIEKKIKKILPKFNNDLSELHKLVNSNKINNIRLKCFHELNSKVKWENILKKICLKEIKEIIGPDILVQSKLNLSIQLPNDKSSILNEHSDIWSADTPFQINLWIPLTNAFKTNSMFILNKEYSLEAFKKIVKKKKYKSIKPKMNEFINISFGKILIFNPALLHGNVQNKTNKTRVSLNIRLKSLFSPEPAKNPDRQFGAYYKKFVISKNTEFATEVLNTRILG
jgi:sporadic carbohydrate cluster 2OG-Fe(II) oxygenase